MGNNGIETFRRLKWNIEAASSKWKKDIFTFMRIDTFVCNDMVRDDATIYYLLQN